MRTKSDCTSRFLV